MEGRPGPGRLPSFKKPRDLTLATPASSAANVALPIPPRSKKNFVPNIPPKRDRNAGAGVEGGSSSSSTSSSLLSSSGERPNGNKPGTAKNRNQKERKKVVMVQSESIFGKGIGDPNSTSRRRAPVPSARESRASSSVNSYAKKSIKSEKEEGGKYDYDALEDYRFLEDSGNFIDDGDEGPTPLDLTPTSFPFTKYISDLNNSAGESGKGLDVRIKTEGTDDKNVAEEKKPIIEEMAPFPSVYRASALKENSIAVFQLPDQLPVLDQTAANDSGTVATTKLANDIGVMPEGAIAKIQIRASGRATLILGETRFDIEPGQFLGFRQELASISTEEKKLTVLGQVIHRFNCIPDVESLLK